MMTSLVGKKIRISGRLLSLLALSTLTEAVQAMRDDQAIAVFINEGYTEIQVNVISEDKKDETVLPLRPKQIERTLFAGGQVKLYTPSKDIVSGRQLFARSMPTRISAPEFMEKGTRTFYFRVISGKVILLKPTDLTSKERKWLKERTKQGW